jgi:hypothetical protein
MSKNIGNNLKQLEMSNELNSIGFDYHGVIDSAPKIFSFLSQSIVKNGGNVHILTGSSWTKAMEDDLKSFGIVWTNGFSVYDHLLNSGVETIGEVIFPDGTVQKKFRNEDWDKIKGEYCRKNNILFHVDDTLVYNDFFTTPFCRFWSHNNKPKAPHKDVRHME